jgi:hypothetical protein
MLGEGEMNPKPCCSVNHPFLIFFKRNAVKEETSKILSADADYADYADYADLITEFKELLQFLLQGNT